VRPIDARPKTIGAMLHNGRYAIDDYQREYKWTTKQVEELLADLSTRFAEEWGEGDPRRAVEGYGGYFLGSVVLSHRDGRSLIVDGQQRLTTLTLLIMYLHRRTQGRTDVRKLDELIYSWNYGERAFNLDVAERTPAMEALFHGESPDQADAPESVRNIVGRYADIERIFPEAVPDEALPWFIDWLVEKVTLVEITAFSDDDAYTIFETMNDRGLSLTPLEMLKGWLLANIHDAGKRAQAGKTWLDRVAALQSLGKDEATNAVKAWLRSQYAQNIRDRKKSATPQDFDRLGTDFHRWLREHREDARVGLTDDEAFFRFIVRDLSFYTRWYERLRHAAGKLTPGLEPVFYLAQYGFTLQYPLLLAPLRPDDPEAVCVEKMRLVASYLDILLARRLWNFRLIAYSTMQYAMFVVMRDIRGLSVPELSEVLRKKLGEVTETFASNPNLRVHQQNRFYIHHLLARMMDHVERQSGQAGRFVEYIGASGTRYEVEHIWANKPERFRTEFPQAADFLEYRNRLGGLLLLPKSFNASYGALPYDQKVKQYLKQNILAASLHPQAYEHNPGFVAYVKRSDLPFRPVEEFTKAELDARQALYRRLAEEVWSPQRLELVN
jgi:hypothetical protein